MQQRPLGLCGVGFMLSKPFLFVGHRAAEAQSRVQAGMIVSCDPRHDFVNRVVPTIALAAHRGPHGERPA